jgi:hypothetical protein
LLISMQASEAACLGRGAEVASAAEVVSRLRRAVETPGAASWRSTTVESSSASVMAATPATVIGAVAHHGIGMIAIGTPARARAMLLRSWAVRAMARRC